MAKPSTATVSELTVRSQQHGFKSIQEIPTEVKTEPIKVAPEDVAKWVAARSGATMVSGAGTKLSIPCTFPEKVTVQMPCLAIARFADRVEALNLDGKTHTFALDEVFP